MADELARWAAGRGERVLARAEDEAVAVLRDALVAAAVGAQERARPRPAPHPEPVAARAASATGELLWAYCVLDDADASPPGLAGVDPAFAVERVEAAGLAALVSRVPRAEFGEAPLRENLNDLEWLERVARAHEAVLDAALGVGTIVPLRLCTLYESADGVRRMLEQEHDAFAGALTALTGREEWGVKILVDPQTLSQVARERSAGAEELADAPGGGGGAYMLRRRHERHVREVADALAAEAASDVRAVLEGLAVDAVALPAQHRDLSGHEGEMLLNTAYLVDSSRVPELRGAVAELEARHRRLGIGLELTGPWPPYNFVAGRDGGVMT